MVCNVVELDTPSVFLAPLKTDQRMTIDLG